MSLDGAISPIVESTRRLARDTKVGSHRVTAKCQALYSQLKVSLPFLFVYFFLDLFAKHCLVSRSNSRLSCDLNMYRCFVHTCLCHGLEAAWFFSF